MTNQTAQALDLLADQATQTREAVLQHPLVLDYLQQRKDKLNLSTCCMQTDDNGQIIKEITKNIRKIAHVPVQVWKSPFGTGWWSWFGGSWWKQLLGYGLIAICGIILLPLCLPCMITLVTKIVRRSLSRILQTEDAIKMMILQKEGWETVAGDDPDEEINKQCVEMLIEFDHNVSSS